MAKRKLLRKLGPSLAIALVAGLVWNPASASCAQIPRTLFVRRRRGLKSQSAFSDLQVGLFGAIPYVVALIAMLFNGWHSDRSRERRWHSAVPLVIGAAGFLCLISLSSSSQMTVLWLSMICVLMAFLPTFWAIPTEILNESTAAVAVGMINALASVAGSAGPYAFGYLHTRTGSFTAGFAVLMFCAFAAAIFMLSTPAAVHRRISESLASS